MYKKILIPMDGSDHSIVAAKHAIQIASDYGSQVTFIYVIADLYNSHRLSEADVKQMKNTFMAQSSEILEKAVKEVQKPNVTIEKKILTGHPAQQIIEECTEGLYDLIVMGSRGLSSVQDFLMGSTSYRVVANAPCPVLIVR